MNVTLAILDSLQSADMLPEFSSARGIFCAIAWFSTVISLGLFLISLFADFGAEGADASAGDAGMDGDVGMFSVRACTGFVLGFGWGGYCASLVLVWAVSDVFFGLLVGLVTCSIVAALMKFIYSLRSDGTLDYGTLTGCTGTVYVTVQPRGEPGGQVQVSHPNQLITIAAVQEGDTPLPAQTRVVVTSATSGQVTVKPL